MTPEEKKEKKKKEREELMKKFLAKGGKVEKIPYSVTKEQLKRGQF
jgi:hypothetical protein|tara:strand:- start:2312 stop:2449 length:138 start_codon:yes stop_codon:yes gene_type:complete